MTTTYLVTGAAGFIGSSVTDALLKRGDRVIGVDNFNDYYSPIRKRKNVEPFAVNDHFSLFECDFSDAAALKKVFEETDIEAVIHLGAMANVRHSVKYPDLFVQANMVGTSNLLEECRRNEITRFVFASTSSVYGQREEVPFLESDSTDCPLAPYPATKKAGELMGHAYFNMYDIQFTALRFFNVYGPKGRPDMMPYIVIERLLNGEEILLFENGEMYRDWTYIDDIVAGVVAAADKPLGFELLNLGRGEPVVMREFMEIAQELVGKKAKIKAVPAPASDPHTTYASVDRIKSLLDYAPQTSLREGFAEFWRWYQHSVMERH